MTGRDSSPGSDGLSGRDRDIIRSVLARYPAVRRVTLFGSRAMGTFGRGSDIDLALEGAGLDARMLTRIATELEDSDLPYKVDLLLRDEQLELKLEGHIRRHGKPFGWAETTLSGVSTDIAYGYTQSADSAKVGPHFLRITDIQNGTVDWSSVPYCKISINDSAKYKLKNGDIVVARTGNSTGENYIFRAYENAVFASYLIRFRVDSSQADPFFVWYSLRTPAWWSFINNSKTGSAQAGANARVLGRFQFLLPPLLEQRIIAGILGALDDKIEQNRRTARALERLARAIFRAWFVDFEPVKAKAVGATSFPGMPQPVFSALPASFADSHIGPLPEGWKFGTIGELVKRVAMGPFGSDIKTENFVSEGVPVIRGGNLTDGFVDEDFVYLTELKADQLSNANAFPGDIVITHRGTLGQVGLIPVKSRYRRYVVSQSQMLLRPSADVLPAHFLYLFLTSTGGQHELLANRSQTGVPAISRPTTSLKAIRVVVPDKPLLRHFESTVSGLFDSRIGIESESRKLAEMRDYLLPKLLSGDVRVTATGTVT